MPRRLFLFVPGILYHPAGVDGWADLAVAWVHRNTPHYADRYEYRSGALTRFAGQKKRVEDLAKMLGRLPADVDVTAVGHSNGCDLLVRLVREHKDVRLSSLHLIAAATERNFARNGLNDALASGRIEDLYLYGSRKDQALYWGQASKNLFGWLGLGYGGLGRYGPTGLVRESWGRVHSMWDDSFGHSTWLAGVHFDETMRLCQR
jgi:predicted alpha/beta hydrolase family esterase